ncbi:migration and invasion-inhibitory protein isoform X1 [Cricetulus griseus]|uniref:migration and invasion-inhibitory protein isoform X1 n=1 Tax=Cricetulus griseus TaxID=10029 RepID=UPI0004543FEA|nr:migration and invasion-inhibitory protein isoform X1 [Cricetulus griseus]XP_007652739.1 migration and invasion-inhibitory protein isoform X1 [Cricetulus griseus]
MAETKDPIQLRLLSLELLKQLWAGHDAMCRSVARAVSEPKQDCSNSSNLEISLSQESSCTSSVAPSSQDKRHVWNSLDNHRGNTADTSWYDKENSRVNSIPPATCQHPEPQNGLWPPSVPLLAPEAVKGPPKGMGPQKTQVPKSVLSRPSKPSKPKVTFSQESVMPESSRRFLPYLGYDWIAGSLDSNSPVTSKPDAFFSELQRFRETNKEDCICDSPEAVFPGLQESSCVEGDHECVYCYRVNRRLFPVPVDLGTTCRLCGISRDQQGPETLAEPSQVRVSIPLSILDPPHQYRIHRRKSFDASDTLALPQHCLLGWDILPPKSEKSSVPKSLDLWSSVSCEGAQRRHLSATSSSLLGGSRVCPNLGGWCPGGTDPIKMGAQALTRCPSNFGTHCCLPHSTQEGGPHSKVQEEWRLILGPTCP